MGSLHPQSTPSSSNERRKCRDVSSGKTIPRNYNTSKARMRIVPFQMSDARMPFHTALMPDARMSARPETMPDAMFRTTPDALRRKRKFPDIFRVIWTLLVVVSFATTQFKNTDARKLSSSGREVSSLSTSSSSSSLLFSSSSSSSSSSSAEEEFEVRAISTSSGRDGLVVVVRPEVKTWRRRRRSSPSLAFHMKTVVAWENDPVEIACLDPQLFVLWKFTQNQTIQVFYSL